MIFCTCKVGMQTFLAYLIISILLSLAAVYAQEAKITEAFKTVSIDTPNPCVRLEKIEGDKIFLRSSANRCIQVISKMQVRVNVSVRKVTVYIDGRVWNEQAFPECDIDGQPQ